MNDHITASEAVFGFTAWLTVRKGSVTLGATHDCAPAAILAKRWCDANNLNVPREDVYPGNIKCPDLCDENIEGKGLRRRCPIDADCEEWRIDKCTNPNGCRLQRKTEVVLCRKSLWVWLQDFLDSLATDEDRHDYVPGGKGRHYGHCPGCTAAKLLEAMKEARKDGAA